MKCLEIAESLVKNTEQCQELNRREANKQPFLYRLDFIEQLDLLIKTKKLDLTNPSHKILLTLSKSDIPINDYFFQNEYMIDEENEWFDFVNNKTADKFSIYLKGDEIEICSGSPNNNETGYEKHENIGDAMKKNRELRTVW